MLEPKNPVTVRVRYTPYPAVALPKAGGTTSKHPVVLRHKHLRRMFTIIPASRVASGLPVARQTVCLEIDTAPLSSGRSAPAVAADVAPAFNAPSQNPASGFVALSSASNAEPLSSSFEQQRAELALTASAGQTTLGAGTGSAAPANVTDDESRLPIVKRGEFTIRDTQHKTIWYSSHASNYLLEPPTVPCASVGHVYVHTTANDDRQLWLFTRARHWEKVNLRHPHPFLTGYVLRLLDNGEPRWVRRETYVKYVAEARKKAHAASSAASAASAA